MNLSNIINMDNNVIAKIITSLAIIIVSLILSRILNKAFDRWNKSFVSKLEKKHPSTVSAYNTKTTIIKKIANSAIYFIAVVLILLQIPAVKNIGAGLLASAGVAGIVIGMAAQNTLSNVFAGISVSFAQPVRLGDAVIFDGDFGWIEDISLMQTIIRTWDNRRIVVPNSILANKVIQNWTMKDPSLLGIVMLYVDYKCDVDLIKKWATEIVEKSEFSTDERVAAVQIVDFTEKTMVLRILGKGKDAPTTWNLRCEIRECLIKKFQESGLALPVIRIEQNDIETVQAPKSKETQTKNEKG